METSSVAFVQAMIVVVVVTAVGVRGVDSIDELAGTFEKASVAIYTPRRTQ